jgi:hypothetical protein
MLSETLILTYPISIWVISALIYVDTLDTGGHLPGRGGGDNAGKDKSGDPSTGHQCPRRRGRTPPGHERRRSDDAPQGHERRRSADAPSGRADGHGCEDGMVMDSLGWQGNMSGCVDDVSCDAR